MSLEKFVRQASPVWLSLLLVACGGGGSVAGPEVGAASGTTDGSGDLSAGGSEIIISGRVADGYIRGATVCVDLNRNDSCDADEPSAVTGEGGSYNLTRPAGAEDAPIVADIPAEAIDEDTGEAIGKALVFIAPAEKPEFLSPITTLIHQEQIANPALDIDEAEQTVKSILGITEEDDVSLFTDYVAESEGGTGDEESAEKFRYLHDTARVVASLMKDIETQVESAAVENGVDVAGSLDTQRAIREIVRSEVRELLPDIARQVAEIVRSEIDSDQDSAETVRDFNPDLLAETLRPEDAGEGVQERIDAVRDRVEVVQSDVRRMLTNGVYWMEFDCHFDYDNYEEHSEEDDTVSAKFYDDAVAGTATPGYGNIQLPECEAFYGHVQLNDAGDMLETEEYLFDKSSSAWVMELEDDDIRGENYSLVDGQWVLVRSGGPEGAVEFQEDGTAVISNAEGRMQIKAVTQDVSATSVINHFWQDGANPFWIDMVAPEDMFASGSLVHKIGVKQSLHPYVLFNHQPEDEDGIAYCAQYGGNCNVINTWLADGQPSAVTTLNEILDGTIQGVELLAHAPGYDNSGTIKLTAEAMADGSLPAMGKVHWIFGQDQSDYDTGELPYDGSETGGDGSDTNDTYPAGYDFPLECSDGNDPVYELPNPDGTVDGQDEGSVKPTEQDATGENVTDQDTSDTAGSDEDGAVRLEDLPATDPDQYPDLPVDQPCIDYAAQTGVVDTNADGTTKPSKGLDEEIDAGVSNADADSYLLSEWKLVEVNGVKLIEIQLPLIFGQGDGPDAAEVLILAEHSNFVRMGARLPESFTERVITYNETAFTTLRSIVEAGFNAQQ